MIHRRSRRFESAATDNRAPHVITVLGDTNPRDSYQEKREAEGRTNFLKEKGYDHSFRHFRALLASSDHVLANLEVSVTEHRESELTGVKPYVDRAGVKATTNLLNSLGIDAVSQANNHTKDFGESGLTDTIAAMKDGDIGCFGAGQTATEAEAVIHHDVTIGERVLQVVFAGGFEHRQSYRN